MTEGETNAKPTVLDWQKPNNTIHNNTEAGFGFGLKPNPKPKPATCLLGLATSKVIFLGSSF